jgi:GTP:adenosylcobinamide-phosphate guanylyltransferase
MLVLNDESLLYNINKRGDLKRLKRKVGESEL